MSMVKETALAVPALALLLFVSSHVFGPAESYGPRATGPKSWLGWVSIPAERFLAKDLVTGSVYEANAESSPVEQAPALVMTPEARIKSVFAQFEPGARRRAT